MLAAVAKPKNLTLISAALLALVTGFSVWLYLSSLRQSQIDLSGQSRKVLVAAHLIPARAKITRDMLQLEDRRASDVDPDALVDPAVAVGADALIAIPAGASITTAEIATKNAALASMLKPGMRAVSITLDRVRGVAGLITPGDRVDVIAIPPRSGDETPVAKTILRGVLVLALGSRVDTVTAPTDADTQNQTTATLGVTPTQADLLAMADINATLRLALRSPEEPANSLPPEHFALTPNAPAAALPPIAAPAVPVPVHAAEPPAAAPGIPVIDGTTGSN
jgi:pilus assembly protein CpaB